jgi:hypothetical protein
MVRWCNRVGDDATVRQGRGRCDGVMGVEDDDGDAAAGVEAEGGVRDGVGDGAVSREVAAMLR